MPRSLDKMDITLNRSWVKEQTDRLIAWEVLQRAIHGHHHTMSNTEMSERLAVGPDFVALLMMKLRRKVRKRDSVAGTHTNGRR